MEKTLLDIYPLNNFLIASGTLNFTRTARRLPLNQPGVRQHIHLLGQIQGYKLFVRKSWHYYMLSNGIIHIARTGKKIANCKDSG
jgi:hypothetical protein